MKKNIQTENTENGNTNFEKRLEKRDAVLGTRKKGHLPLIVALVCSVIIVGGAIYYVSYDRSASPPVAAAFSSENSLSQVTLPASLFEDGQARHFEHVSGNFAIKYFILKSSDGVIRAAFDACDVCWPAGKGYYQDGDDMVCRNCGRRFASVLVNEVQGGCNPAPLNRIVQGDQLILKADEIIKGRSYFDLKGKV